MSPRRQTGRRDRMCPRDRQRGNVIILFAVLLPMLLGFAALVVDLGHGWQVRNQLQNAADAAALAGARDLDGTPLQYVPARLSAVYYSGLHQANGASVSLPIGNVVLGNWNFLTRTFTPDPGTMPSYRVNAVSVTAPTLTVSTWLAPILGISSENVGATAIAVGGSPDASCGFPLAVPACSLISDGGQIRCNSVLTFGQATTDNVGFTVFSSSPGVNTPGINCAFARALGIPCPGGCNCTTSCNPSAIANGQIYISNGNNLSQSVVDWINQYIAAHPSGMYAEVPVLDSGSLTQSGCGSFTFNQLKSLVGYVELRITGATGSPNKTITATVDCTRSGPAPPGGSGGFYGYKSTSIYLVR
jgi:hypothetical protein